MLQWFRNWRCRRHRMIYRYFDGKSWRFGDPIGLSQSLATHSRYRRKYLANLDSNDIEEQKEAVEVVSNAAQEVFGAKILDDTGQGLTISEQISLVLDFEIWTEALKKNTTPFVG